MDKRKARNKGRLAGFVGKDVVVGPDGPPPPNPFPPPQNPKPA